MRTIKFRAWVKDEEVMGKVTSIDLWSDDPNMNSFEVITDEGDLTDELLPDEVILMQYTGVKDKEGVEIYEGDVLETPDGIKGEIEFVPEHAAFLAYWKLDGNCGYDYLEGDGRLKKCKIIGNVHEHPHLIGGESE